jgi:hypothetical protein
MPRCCWRLETSETRDVFWLSYGDAGLIWRWPIPTFMRLSTLLRRESKCEPASMLKRLSPNPWLREGNGALCWEGCQHALHGIVNDVPVEGGQPGAWQKMAYQARYESASPQR